MTIAMIILGCLLGISIVGYFTTNLLIWSLIGLAVAYGLGASNTVLAAITVVLVLINIKWTRCILISGPVLKLIRALNLLPAISETEKTAIESGNVWMDGELFSGIPDFKTLLSQPFPDLTQEEQAFLDGPCEELCKMVDDWTVHHERGFSETVWEYMKKEKFFGMIIPKKYGGLEFSATAHSAVIAKLSSRTTPLGITVMVPNSLGPAELLQHYGTQAQKDHYLPRLAAGEEIPCFALTEPGAGSDAGAISSHGEVIKNDDGSLALKLNWNKRYITLAAISTVLGLAFKLRDPHNYLGKGENPGITCVLIPSETPGVVLGRRHDPLNVPFYNCPTTGTDVIVPIESIIGGTEWAGKGWRMLVESLAAGRGISLPANATGGAKLVSRVVGAYSAIRVQFGLSIGKFEGVQEKMAEIGGFTYMMDAARRYTTGGLDKGEKPAIVTAIMKYNMTEMFRTAINHGIDILGGAAISRGPRNILAHPYMATPIGITVEGANILTRTLMVFGQGVIRCHPTMLQEITAIEKNDVAMFDEALTRHIGHVIKVKQRYLLLTLTRGRLASSPVPSPEARYVQKLTWASSVFALLADSALITLGANLKRREQITGRFADVLSWLYIGTAVLRRYKDEGFSHEDRALFKWSMDYALYQIQIGLEGILRNMSIIFKPMYAALRINPIGTPPSDKLTVEVASLLQVPGQQRDRLTDGIYIPTDTHDALGRYEEALNAVTESQETIHKIKQAVKAKTLEKAPMTVLINNAVGKGIITEKEAEQMNKAEQLREEAISVDSFTLDEYKK